jgi:hypothetical protein
MLSLVFMVQGILQVPIEGSITLFILLAGLHLFATTSMGIFLATTLCPPRHRQRALRRIARALSQNN